jgi:hypothetical protein
MDAGRFDSLTRSLSTAGSRRRALHRLAEGQATRRSALRVLGGALTALGVSTLADATTEAKGDGKVTTEGDRGRQNRSHKCLPSSRSKLCYLKPPKGKERSGCKKCCESFREVPEKPKYGKCCTPNGLACESAAECCLGSCSVGLCQNETVSFPVSPPPPPGEAAPPPPPSSCRLYGESCSVAADCCNGVPCVGGTCRFN